MRKGLKTQFPIFVTASGLTNLADGIALLAWGWLASMMTRDPVLIAALPVALRLPWFVFAIPAGIVADRVDRRRLILCMDCLRFGGFCIAALLVFSALPLAAPPEQGVAQPVVFYALMVTALLIGACEVFRDNCAQTILPRLVPREKLEQANGRLWSIEMIGNSMIGPALGAFLITFSPPAPLAMNAAAYAMAVICMVSIRGDFSVRGAQSTSNARANWQSELAQAYRFLTANRLIFSLAWITGVWNLFFQMFAIALILHGQENLGLDAMSYGLLLTVEAIGGLIAGFWGAQLVKRTSPKQVAQWALVASPLCFFAMALAPNWTSLALLMAVFRFSGMLWNTVSVSHRQRHIADHMLGRVNSLFRLLAWGLMPVGLLLSGVIVRLGEPIFGRSIALSLPIFCAAAGSLFLAIYGWRALERGFAAHSS